MVLIVSISVVLVFVLWGMLFSAGMGIGCEAKHSLRAQIHLNLSSPIPFG